MSKLDPCVQSVSPTTSNSLNEEIDENVDKDIDKLSDDQRIEDVGQSSLDEQSITDVSTIGENDDNPDDGPFDLELEESIDRNQLISQLILMSVMMIMILVNPCLNLKSKKKT